MAANTLGRLRARESAPALREAADTGGDIYLRAAALRSLIAIEGAGSLRPWLDELSRSAPFNVRAIARRALDETAGEVWPDVPGHVRRPPARTGPLTASSPAAGVGSDPAH